MSASVRQYGKVLVVLVLAMALVLGAVILVEYSQARRVFTPLIPATSPYWEPLVTPGPAPGDPNRANREGIAAEIELSRTVTEDIASRNYHRRVWNVIRDVEVADPNTGMTETQERVSRIVEVGGGICYRDALGNFQVTNAAWRVEGDLFVMDTADYQLRMGLTLETWLEYTVDQEVLYLRPAGIQAHLDQEIVPVAAVNVNSEGAIDPTDTSQLVFTDAFGTGIDLVLIVEPGGYHQNIVFRQKPAFLDQWDPQALIDLQVYTELSLDEYTSQQGMAVFIGRNEYVDLTQPLNITPTQESLEFVKVVEEDGQPVGYDRFQFVESKIFATGDKGREQIASAYKQLFRDSDNKTYLIESLDQAYLQQADYPLTWDYATKNSNITSDEVWYADRTYWVSADISVSGCTLKIEPGTFVKFDDNCSLTTVSNGKLIARGLPHLKIVFTTDVDDDNGEHIATGTVDKGDWDGLTLNAADSELEYCFVRAATNGICVKALPAIPIRHSQINKCNTGIKIDSSLTIAAGSALQIFNNIINVHDTCIEIQGSGGQVDIWNNSFKNNDLGIKIASGSSRDMMINNNIFYSFDDDAYSAAIQNEVNVYDDPSPTATLDLDYNAYFENSNDIRDTTVSPYITKGDHAVDDTSDGLTNPFHTTYLWYPISYFYLNEDSTGGNLLKNAGSCSVADAGYGDYRQWSIYHVPETAQATGNTDYGFKDNVTITQDTIWKPNYETCDTGRVSIGFHFPRIDYFAQDAIVTVNSKLTIEPGTVIALRSDGIDEGELHISSSGELVCKGNPFGAGYVKIVDATRASHYRINGVPYSPTQYGIKCATDDIDIQFTKFWGLSYALYFSGAGNVMLRDCQFRINKRAVYVNTPTNNCYVACRHCLFIENQTGYYNLSSITGWIENCTFDRNSDAFHGNLSGGTSCVTKLQNCLFTTNVKALKKTGSAILLGNTNNIFYTENASDYPNTSDFGTVTQELNNPYDSSWTSVDDRFYLDQDESAVDVVTSTEGMPGYTTSIYGFVDSGNKDVGYHYPLPDDTDGDGLYDYEEYWLGTNINSADSDGDSMSDYWEVAQNFDATSSPNAYLQDSGTDGLVVMEAEHYDARIAGDTHTWDPCHYDNDSGWGVMTAEPDSGTFYGSGSVSSSPRLDYRIKFVKTGTHYIWIRGRGPNGYSDSCHVGLNGSVVTTSADFYFSTGDVLRWNNKTLPDHLVAEFTISQAEVHTLNIWMREDGSMIDKIVITSNSNYQPFTTYTNEIGPSESGRESSQTVDGDGDGLNDLQEYEAGTDPTLTDSDGDGMSDDWEWFYGTDPTVDDADADPDQDGISNLIEYQLRDSGFDPLDNSDWNQNSDYVAGTDTLPDWWEYKYFGSTTSSENNGGDYDSDGLDNLVEFEAELDPTVVNTNTSWVWYDYKDSGTPVSGALSKQVQNEIRSQAIVENSETHFAYDDLGRRWRERRLATPGGSESNSNDAIALTEYDVLGRVYRTVRKAPGSSTYDDRKETNDIVTEYSYDNVGRQSTIESGYWNGSLQVSKSTTYSYSTTSNHYLVTIDTSGDRQEKHYYDMGGREDTVEIWDTEPQTDVKLSTRETEYNSLEQIVKAYLKDGSGNKVQQERQEYNNVGALTRHALMLDPDETQAIDETTDRVTDYVYEYTYNQSTKANQTIVYDTSGNQIIAQHAETELNSTDPTGRGLPTVIYKGLKYDTQPTPNEIKQPHTKEELSYNKSGQVTKRVAYNYETDGSSYTLNFKVTTMMEYDQQGRMTKSYVDGATDLVTLYEYDGVGRRIEETNPKNIVTSYDYGHFGQMILKTEDDDGNTQRTTQYIYDRLGQLTYLVGNDGTNNQTTTYTYDALGQVVTVDYPTSGTDDQIVYVYGDTDAGGKPTKRVHKTDATTTISTCYIYDVKGQLITKFRDDNNDGNIDSTDGNNDDNELLESYAYDARGLMTQAAKGIVANFDATSLVSFTYNGLGNLTNSQQTIAEGTAYKVDYTRDPQGRPTQIEYPFTGASGTAYDFTYTSLGNINTIKQSTTTLVSYAYAGSHVIERDYDDAGVSHRRYYDSEYARTSKLFTFTGTEGSPTTNIAEFDYSYDSNSNIISQDFGHAGKSYNNYTYDNLDRLVDSEYNRLRDGLVGYWKMDEGTGATTYDETTNDNDGTLYGTPGWVDGKLYKALDFVEIDDDYVGIPDADSISVGTGNYTICAWIYPHSVSGLQGIACKVDGFTDKEYGFCITGTYLDLEVEKDGNNGGARTSSGVISQDQWQHVAVVFDSSTLTPVFYHDGTVKAVSTNTINVLPDQLSADLNIGQFGGSMAGSYNFDGVIDEVRIYNRKLSASEISTLYRNSREEFDYDLLGNRETMKQDGTSTTYLHNVANEYTSIGGNAVDYDLAGNLIEDHNGYTYSYDYENRLIEIKDNTAVTIVTYAYDALGRRIEKDDNIANETTTYYYDGWRVLTDIVDDGAGAVRQDYVYGNYLDEMLIMCRDDTTDYYFAHDHLYSPVALMKDVSGQTQVVERYEYDAYGAVQVMSADYVNRSYSTYGNTIGFTGQRRDRLNSGGLELMYYKNRYYHPDMGRFVNRDPFEYVDGMNVYEYVRSKCSRIIDPYGFWGKDIHQDLTRQLAQLAGADHECARLISQGTQYPDELWDAPVMAGVFFKTYLAEWADKVLEGYDIDLVDVTEEDKQFADEAFAQAIYWHFPADPDGVVRPDSPMANLKKNEGLDKCDLFLFAQGLHSLQDSYSHQGKPPINGIGHARGVWEIKLPFFGTKYIKLTGIPAALTHTADNPFYWPEDARGAAMNTYDEIRDFMKKCECQCKRIRPAKSREDVRDWLEDKNKLLEGMPGKGYKGKNVVNWVLP